MGEEYLKYAIWLDGISGLGRASKIALVKAFGSAKNVYMLNDDELIKTDCIKPAKKKLIREAKTDSSLEDKYALFLKSKVKAVSYEGKDYPEQLRNIYDPPYVLYYFGRLPDENRFSVGIVGARMCDEYGRTYAIKIARELTKCGCQIISGMAYGIDAASHWGCIKGGGDTYGILGCGPDVIYPEKNTMLYEEIIKKGGVISELFPGTLPKPGFFPLRNRIISALSDVLIVIEAKEKSGSLITADLALEQGKDVYVIPGRITDALSFGTNSLIKQGAGIITSVEDLIKELGFETKYNSINSQAPKKELEKEELMLYSVLDLHEKYIEDIIAETNLERESAYNALINLVKKGYARESFRNYYLKI